MHSRLPSLIPLSPVLMMPSSLVREIFNSSDLAPILALTLALALVPVRKVDFYNEVLVLVVEVGIR